MISAARFLLTALIFALCPLAPVGAGVVQLADEIVLSQERKAAIFPDTGAAGMQLRPSRVSFDSDVIFEDFFRCAYEGHQGVMQRASLEQVATGQYRGHGWIAGNIWRAVGGTAEMPAYRPFAVIETWGVGVVPANFRYLMPKSASPALQDWVQYKVSVQSTRTILNFVRYRIHRLGERGQYELIFDTGDVLDNNWGVDMSRQAIILFDATDANAVACPYRIRYIRPLVSWSSADVDLPDLTGLPWVKP